MVTWFFKCSVFNIRLFGFIPIKQYIISAQNTKALVLYGLGMGITLLVYNIVSIYGSEGAKLYTVIKKAKNKMIKIVLKKVIELLNTFIDGDEEQLDGVVVLGNLAQQEENNEIKNKVVLSIINIQQEGLLRNLSTNIRSFNNEGKANGTIRNPGVYLNIYLLIGANKDNDQYGNAIDDISQVITFFQKNPVFTVGQIPEIKKYNLDKIIFDLYSTSFEELNHFWGIMGGKYLPSVVYKMQLAFMEGLIVEEDIPFVKTIKSKSDKI